MSGHDRRELRIVLGAIAVLLAALLLVRNLAGF
jgi:hypothetical protein